MKFEELKELEAKATPELIAEIKWLRDALNIETAGHDNTADELHFVEEERDHARARAEKAEQELNQTNGELMAAGTNLEKIAEINRGFKERIEKAEARAKSAENYLVEVMDTRDAENRAKCDALCARAEKAEKENEEVREWGRKKHERIQELEQELRQMHVRTVDAEKHAEQMQAERDVLAERLSLEFFNIRLGLAKGPYPYTKEEILEWSAQEAAKN